MEAAPPNFHVQDNIQRGPFPHTPEIVITRLPPWAYLALSACSPPSPYAFSCSSSCKSSGRSLAQSDCQMVTREKRATASFRSGTTTPSLTVCHFFCHRCFLWDMMKANAPFLCVIQSPASHENRYAESRATTMPPTTRKAIASMPLSSA